MGEIWELLYSGVVGLDPASSVSLPSPKCIRNSSSLVNFSDEYIFVIGGILRNGSTNKAQACDPSTEKYCLKTDTWSYGPKLVIYRMYHSSCQQGDMLYAFGGRSTSSNHLTSIERVNARKHINKEIRQMGQTEDETNRSEVEEGIDTWEIIILKDFVLDLWTHAFTLS